MKTHHYIISFDPKDAVENGLTMERAQALDLQFCKDNFPGHPAIVCTHPDGHNRSGNIHVHIVIGSVRTREVERKPYMQKPRDWLEGMKHSSTAQTMRHLRVEVMELCEGAGLYQIDLLNGSKERVSEAEYWARVHVEMASSCIVLHVCVLSALRHLYSCDLCDTVFFLIRFRTHSRQGRALVFVSEENKKSEPFSYRENVRIFMVWCDGRDSNPRPTDS